VQTCASCGHQNPPDARFCNRCAAPLTAAPPEQLKTLTILFADVTGSTELGEQLDPEAVRRVMERYFEFARRVITRHGGTVEKFIGDAVVAVFGVPGSTRTMRSGPSGRPLASEPSCRASTRSCNGTTGRPCSCGPESTPGRP